VTSAAERSAGCRDNPTAMRLHERLVTTRLADRFQPPRRRVFEFGRYWLSIKKLVVDAGTNARYHVQASNARRIRA
jgi:hypothetical protein